MLYRVSWIDVNGISYKHDGVVILNVDLVPTFGIIIDIIALDVDDYWLICEVTSTICFNSHYHSYEVCKDVPPHYVVCQLKNLADNYVLSAYELGTHSDTLFIPMKYYVIDTV